MHPKEAFGYVYAVDVPPDPIDALLKSLQAKSGADAGDDMLMFCLWTSPVNGIFLVASSMRIRPGQRVDKAVRDAGMTQEEGRAFNATVSVLMQRASLDGSLACGEDTFHLEEGGGQYVVACQAMPSSGVALDIVMVSVVEFTQSHAALQNITDSVTKVSALREFQTVPLLIGAALACVLTAVAWATLHGLISWGKKKKKQSAILTKMLAASEPVAHRFDPLDSAPPTIR